MKETTLCYIMRNDRYLMLHRIKKNMDPNAGKWIGVGGKFEGAETPEECMLREVKEETGLTLDTYRFQGIVTFISDQWEAERIFLFTALSTEGEVRECDEGVFEWVPKTELSKLNMWDGDYYFLPYLGEREFFSLKLRYEGEKVVEREVKVYY